MKRDWRCVALFLALLAQASPAGAQYSPDLHAYWDQRCRTCHGHSADFARRFLHLTDGRLAGQHHVDDLDIFLRNHYLNDEWLVPVTAMLSAQASTEPLFRERCARCHGSAADFARKSLRLRDDVVTGTRSGRPITVTLRAHGGLSPQQARVVAVSLQRVLSEVTRSGQ